ncbi:MAG: HEAT repeat domain-containing protein [Candidatus Heimdallarchaeaceae archaeon]
MFKRWLMIKKLRSEIDLDRLKAVLFLRKKGKDKDIDNLLPLLSDKDWNVRNATALTIIKLVNLYPEKKEEILLKLHQLLEKRSLATKLSVLEILGQLRDYSSKDFIKKIIEESDYDLQYAAIRAIGYLDDVDILSSLKEVVYSKDYITRRAVIFSILRIVNSVEEEKKVELLTPHIHLLIQVYLELNELGEVIYKILDYGDPEQFPGMKAYSEFEIIRLTSLIEQYDYRVPVYKNFAKIIYPLYFPLNS